CFFFQAEDGIRDFHVTGVQTCALPIFGLGGLLFRHTTNLGNFTFIYKISMVYSPVQDEPALPDCIDQGERCRTGSRPSSPLPFWRCGRGVFCLEERCYRHTRG